jgi:hypothetical protein
MDDDAARRRLKLGIDDSQQDVYESPDVPDVAPPSANAELEAARYAEGGKDSLWGREGGRERNGEGGREDERTRESALWRGNEGMAG